MSLETTGEPSVAQPQDSSDPGTDRRMLAPRESIDRCAEVVWVEMGVAHRHSGAGVAEELGNDVEADALAGQGACEIVADVVEAERSRDSCQGFRQVEAALDPDR